MAEQQQQLQHRQGQWPVVVTPSASREDHASNNRNRSSNSNSNSNINNTNIWLDRLLRGERLTVDDWQQLGSHEKVRVTGCDCVCVSYGCISVLR